MKITIEIDTDTPEGKRVLAAIGLSPMPSTYQGMAAPRYDGPGTPSMPTRVERDRNGDIVSSWLGPQRRTDQYGTPR